MTRPPFGASLTDEQLIALRDRTTANCNAIVALPLEEQRSARGTKGGASLEDVGFVQAIFATLAQQELDRRAQTA